MTDARYDAYLGHWVKRLYLAMTRQLHEQLEPHGVTAAQFNVLVQLWQAEPLSQRDLQQRLGTRSATLTGLLDRMQQQGWIRREPSPEDARSKWVHLTPLGRQLQDMAESVIAGIEARMTGGFAPEEVQVLRVWLRRLLANLESPGHIV